MKKSLARKVTISNLVLMFIAILIVGVSASQLAKNYELGIYYYVIPFVSISLASLIIYLTISIFIVKRKVLVPLKELAENISKIDTSQDNTNEIYGENRDDEIGSLSKSIKNMILKIRENSEKFNEATSRQLQIYDASPIPSSLWSLDFTPLDCNQAMVKLLGMNGKDDFLYRFAEFNPEIQPNGMTTPEMVHYVVNTVREKGICHYDYFFITASGDLVPGECIAKRVDLKDYSFLTVHFQDSRPRLEAEKKQKELSDQVQQEQQRMAIAEESNRAKSQFLARMSHEIRTPISAVMGISEIQLRKKQRLPAQIEESFAMINSSAEALLRIVNDILNLSKIESGKMETIIAEYEVATLIRHIIKPQFIIAQKRGIGFNVDISKDIPKFFAGDELRIGQIMNNILSNAFKYTESGEVALSMRYADGQLVIVVKDTGLGMTPKQLGDLNKYNEYVRFHERTNRDIDGTGLGMPIVFNLVQMMKATINIDSEVGKGTTVTVEIPQQIISNEVLGDASEYLQQLKDNKEQVIKKLNFEPEPMPYGKVLVVDDLAANLYVAKGLLSFYEIEVEICSSGFEAIEKIQLGNVYDIIFMDNMMPGLDGIETMERIKGVGYTAPIVVLTASALFGEREKFIESGFDGFLSKPIQTDELNDILVSLIKDKQPQEVLDNVDTNTKEKQRISDFQQDMMLLKTLRTDFVREQKDVCTDIRKSLRENKHENAHILVHSIKGLAGLIHEMRLVEIAAHVEDFLEDNKVPPEEEIDKLEAELKIVIDKINEVGAPEPVNSEILKVLHDLEDLLEGKNTKALDLVSKLSNIPEAIILVHLVEKLKFKEALMAVQVLKNIFTGVE